MGDINGNLILTRIAWAHTNYDWINLFPSAKVYHLPKTTCDHFPILLKTNTSSFIGLKPFRLELLWINHPDFLNIIKDSWISYPNNSLDSNLLNSPNKIHSWSKKTFKNIFSQKKLLLKILLGIQNTLCIKPNLQLNILEKNLQAKFNIILEQVESLLETGIHNTTILRRRRNLITCIKDTEGNFSFEPSKIRKLSLFISITATQKN